MNQHHVKGAGRINSETPITKMGARRVSGGARRVEVKEQRGVEKESKLKTPEKQ